MNNQQTPAADAMIKLNNSLARTSLDELVRATDRRSLLLLDVSYSMDETIRGGARKIDALRKVVTAFQAEQPTPMAAFGLDYPAAVAVVDSIPEPTGGTPTAEAIEFGYAQGANHLVIVTDGVSNDHGAAVRAASTLNLTVDVIFVGNKHDRGSVLAQEIAEAGRGTFTLGDLGKPLELGSKLRGLLGDGSEAKAAITL